MRSPTERPDELATDLTITLDENGHRFAATTGSLTASLQYRRRGDRFVIVHTDVPAELRGRGLGRRLVEAAVAHASARGDTVVPLCPFARQWLRQHRDTAATVDIDWGSAS